MSTETIPGKAGVIDFGADYGAKYIDVSCNIFPKASFAALVAVLDNIAEWLDPTAGEKQLIFDDVPERFYWARLSSAVDCQRLIRSSGEFSLRFLCADPYAYAVADEEYTITAAQSLVITRLLGNADSSPIYSLKGYIPAEAASGITIFTNRTELNIKGPLAINETLIIDASMLTAKITDTTGKTLRNGLSCLQKLNFPVLHKGQNSVSVTATGKATVSQLHIQAKSRWK